MTSSMLDSKFYLPRARPDAVPRARLLDSLDRGNSASFTLVCAPAGFGKTTLLAQWLERRTGSASGGPSVAWLSLDAGDNEPRTYWSCLLTALRRVAPQFGVEELALLQAGDPPPIQRLLTSLLNDLGAQPADVVLVLDDYHVIESPEVHEAMAFLLDHAPPRLHLLMTSRADPAVPLARLRARAELVEVRESDLRFTHEEAAAYLNDAMGLRLTAAEVSTLEQRTEGWIAALQLAALSLQKRADVAEFIDGFSGQDRYIVDYLVEEVLQRQPDRIVTFLLQTSILDTFDGPLCDAVTGQGGARATLEALDRANLFLVPLDDRRRRYRYHHLFADVLRARLRDEHAGLVPVLHQRASRWYEQHGERADAIRHALTGADFERAAELVEREAPASRRDRRERALLGWLQALPNEVLRNRPVLSVAYAGALLSTGAVEGVEQRLLDAERWVAAAQDAPEARVDTSTAVVGNEEEFRRLPGWVALYRAAQALALGDASTSVDHVHVALGLLDQADETAIAAASALLGLASWGRGDLDAAHQAYTDCSVLFRRIGHLSDVLACAITLADIRVTQGRLRQAMSTYEQALPHDVPDRTQGMHVLRGTGDMYVGMSEVHRERNELDAAKECLNISHQLGEHLGLPQNRYRWRVATARVHEAEGDLDAALALLDDAERTYVADFAPEVRPVSAHRARVWVRQGRLDEASDWARERGLAVDDELTYLRELEHMTFARVLIARFAADGSERDWVDANDLLDGLLRAADDGGRTASVLAVLVLKALAAQLRGDTARALVPLHRALRLAAPERHVRVFLDEGPPMMALLQAAASDGSRDLVNPLLSAALLQADAGWSPSAGEAALIAPLSEPERKVLRLLTTDLSGPDIARELVVSLSTVRTHTRSIYSKLGVSSRRSAVRRARELDLLRPSPQRR